MDIITTQNPIFATSAIPIIPWLYGTFANEGTLQRKNFFAEVLVQHIFAKLNPPIFSVRKKS